MKKTGDSGERLRPARSGSGARDRKSSPELQRRPRQSSPIAEVPRRSRQPYPPELQRRTQTQQPRRTSMMSSLGMRGADVGSTCPRSQSEFLLGEEQVGRLEGESRAERKAAGTCALRWRKTVELSWEDLVWLVDRLDGDSLVLREDLYLANATIPAGSDLVRFCDETVDGADVEGAIRQIVTVMEAHVQAKEGGGVTFRLLFSCVPWTCFVAWPCLVPLLVLGAAVLISQRWFVSRPDIRVEASYLDQVDGSATSHYVVWQRVHDEQIRLQASPNSVVLVGKARTLHLTFESGGSGTLTSPHLEAAKALEEHIRALPHFREACGRTTAPWTCAIGASLTNFAYPSGSSTSSVEGIAFDADGNSALLATSAAAISGERGLWRALFPRAVTYAVQVASPVEGLDAQLTEECVDLRTDCADFVAQGSCIGSSANVAFMLDFCQLSCSYCLPTEDSESVPVPAFRSHLSFLPSCCWREFLNELHEALDAERVKEVGSAAGLSEFHAWFSGTHVVEYSIDWAAQDDVQWGIFGAFAALMCVLLFTRGLCLSIGAMMLVCLAPPVAFEVYFAAAGSASVSVTMMVAVYICIAVGPGLLFAYTAAWTRSAEYSRSLLTRVKLTYGLAGIHSITAAVVLCLAFFSGLASDFRAVREFGFFAGILVAVLALMVFLAYPFLLVMSEKLGDCFKSCAFCRWTSKRWFPCNTHTLRTFSDAYVDALRSCSWLLTLALIIGAIGCVIVGFLRAEATWATDLFRENHNMKKTNQWNREFETYVPELIAGATDPNGTLCSNLFVDGCSIYSCNADLQIDGDVTTCKCYEEDNARAACGEVSTYSIDLVAVVGGYQAEPLDFSAVALPFYAGLFPNSSVSLTASSSWIKPLEAENWEYGVRRYCTLHRSPSVSVQADGSGSDCNLQHVCYCGAPRCESSTSVAVGELNIGASERRLRENRKSFAGEGRSSQGTELRRLTEVLHPTDQAEVTVVFGIESNAKDTLIGAADSSWSYSGVSLEDPDVQADLYNACDLLSNTEELEVVRHSCWVAELRRWREARGEEWPVPVAENIHDVIRQAMTAGDDALSSALSEQLWWDETAQRVFACIFSYYLNIVKDSTSDDVATVREAWDRAVSQLVVANLKTAWHTSETWLRKEAQDCVLMSAVRVGGVALILVSLSTLCFTLSLRLTVAVLFCVLGVLGWALVFMLEGVAWKIGVVETVALLAALALAADCALHLARRYGSCGVYSVQCTEATNAANRMSTLGHKTKGSQSVVLKCSDYLAASLSREERQLVRVARPEERSARTRHALQELLVYMSKASFTFLACIALMWPCTLQLFHKVAGTMLGVGIVSVCFTVCLLPALLLLMGPTLQQHIRERMHTAKLPKSLYIRKFRPRMVGLAYGKSRATSTRVLANG